MFFCIKENGRLQESLSVGEVVKISFLRTRRTKWKTLEFKRVVSNPAFVGTILFPALGWVRLEGVAGGQCMLPLGWMNVAFSIRQNPATLLIHVFCFTPRLEKELKHSCCEILRIFRTQVCTTFNSKLYSTWVFLESLARNGWLALVVQKNCRRCC